jgi:hypothetical protein
MLKAPLFDQKRVVEAYEDGREKVTQLFKASRWAKRDALRYSVGGFAMTGAAIRNEGATAATQILEVDEWDKMVPFTGEEVTSPVIQRALPAPKGKSK